LFIRINEISYSPRTRGRGSKSFWSKGKFGTFSRYYLPDPPAIPTKEGGAELDVSGVWTFTTMMSPDIGINETGTSGTKLLATPTPMPNRTDADTDAAAAMLALLGSATPKNFPAPPMRKRPHQCSTHSIGVLSSASTSCSSPMMASRGHRSNLLLPTESIYSVPNTRSCGTNVGGSFHQRSVSAFVSDHRRAVSYVVDDGGGKMSSSAQHQRSLSSQQQQQSTSQHHFDDVIPPALPPKLGSGVIFRPSELSLTPTKLNDVSQNVVPSMQMSFLQQLVQSSPNNPELLDTLRRHQIEPQPRRSTPKLSTRSPKPASRSPKIVTRSPSCAASLYSHHQRAVSMLEPVTSYEEAASPATPSGRYVKHIRSSSTLAPTPETPSSRRVIHHRSSSNVVGRVASSITPVRHSKMLTPQQLQQQQQQQQQQKIRHQLHKSTSNLSNDPDGVKRSHHQRSSSTPYEGFVV